MLSNTDKLFNLYFKFLKEQGEQPVDPSQGFDTTGGQNPDDVTQNPEPTSQEEMPMTSEGEEQYIEDMIDAALHVPSSEDAKTLTNLQSVMKMKRFKNAREEILPILLNIIRPTTESSEIRDTLSKM